MTKLNPHLNIHETSYEKLKKEPFVWGEKIYENKEFFTPNKKANLHFVQNKLLSEKTNIRYPFILLTGRTRDQWHSGTKTNLPRTLLNFKPLNFCEINKKDAKELDILHNDKIKILSSRGELITTALLTDNIKEKTIFIPVSNRDMNYLTNDILDKESFQPDYNHSTVRIEKVDK